MFRTETCTAPRNRGEADAEDSGSHKIAVESVTVRIIDRNRVEYSATRLDSNRVESSRVNMVKKWVESSRVDSDLQSNEQLPRPVSTLLKGLIRWHRSIPTWLSQVRKPNVLNSCHDLFRPCWRVSSGDMINSNLTKSSQKTEWSTLI